MLQLQKRYSWCLALALIPLVFGETLNFPNSVICGQNFSVYLETNLTGVFDVKIDIFNSSGSRISRIFNGEEWQSTFNYLNSAINTSVSNSSWFSINITEIFNGTSNINVTLRQDSKLYKSSYWLNVSYLIISNVTTTNITINNPLSNKIVFKIDAEDEFYSDETLDVSVKAFNLGNDSYDVKVYLTLEGSEEIISETYNEEEWKSSNYYIDSIFSKVNESEKVEVRLKDSSYSGKIIINAKLRKAGSIIAEDETSIEAIKRTPEPAIYTITDTLNNTYTSEKIEVIELNKPQSIKSQEIWNSKTQNIKDYAIYGFSLFCVLIMILLVMKKL